MTEPKRSQHYRPLTLSEWVRLCEGVRTMPSKPPWLSIRNEAMLYFHYAFGPRADESSKYRLCDVWDETGILRLSIPFRSLIAGEAIGPAWHWRTVPDELYEALQRWYAVYPGRRTPEAPLWCSRTGQGYLKRKGIWEPLKKAGIACGISSVNPESLRKTKIFHEAQRWLAHRPAHSLQELWPLFEAVQREMRHRYIHQTIQMLYDVTREEASL